MNRFDETFTAIMEQTISSTSMNYDIKQGDDTPEVNENQISEDRLIHLDTNSNKVLD